MKDVCEPRKASKVKPVFPWTDRKVPLILVTEAGVVEYAVSVTGKIALLERADDGAGVLTVLSVWPGIVRSDAFVVDDVSAALASLRSGKS